MSLVNKNGFKNYIATIHHGPVYAKDYDSDGSLWLPAANAAGAYITFVGTFTPTRAAAGDYYSALTAAANSPFVVLDLNQVFEKIGSDPIFTPPSVAIPGTAPAVANAPGYTAPATGVGITKVNDDYEGHIIRGMMLCAYDVVYTIGTANLTTFTGTCYETSYSTAGAAGVVTTMDAAQNIGKTTNANIQIQTIQIATPYVVGGNSSVQGGAEVADYLELAIVNPGTSVLHLYGIRLYFDYCWL